LVEDEVGAEVGRWAVPQPFVLVGRHPRLDLSLDAETVSQRHAYLQVLGGRVYCVDLGSRSGVAWGPATEPSGWLDPGRSIGVGPYRIRLGGGVPEGVASVLARPNPLARVANAGSAWGRLPGVAIEVPHKADGPGRWRIRQVLTLIGRVADCRLQVRDDSISRFHAALVRLPEGLWVVDLLSREGIRVNGARVRWSRLGDGDQLHVGRYRLVVRLGEPEPAGGEPEPGAGSELDSEPEFFPPLPPDQLPALLRGMAAPANRVAPEGQLRQILRGRPPEQAAMAEALLQPLIQQFGMMQQQMFDQFHQAMLAMFQMFGSLHRDQMKVVREELDRIRQLGQELQVLQVQLQAQERARQQEPEARPRNARAESIDAARPVVSAANPVPEPLRPGPQATNDTAANSVRSQTPWEAEHPAGTPPRRAPVPAETASSAELHARLARRIQEIQNERQTRWQRLVGLLSGGGGAAP
jgi:pSer/pThr/pTyr-binding forkhead associated (FHA) protein